MSIRVYDVDEESSASSRSGISVSDGILDDDDQFDIAAESSMVYAAGMIEYHKEEFEQFLEAINSSRTSHRTDKL
jgi:hypothetical protein